MSRVCPNCGKEILTGAGHFAPPSHGRPEGSWLCHTKIKPPSVTRTLALLWDAVRDAERTFRHLSDETNTMKRPIASSLGWLLRHNELLEGQGLCQNDTKE